MLSSLQQAERLDDMQALSSLTDVVTTHEAFRLIDEAIERNQAAANIQLVLTLKSQRNTYAPISRLPTEILCKIFSIVKINEPYIFGPIGGRIPELWVKLTHVSRRWRDVAIDSPTLWTELPLEDPPWVERILIRSKGHRLEVEGGVLPITYSPRYISTVKLALGHGQRIKTLSLRIDQEQHWQMLQKAIPKNAAELEHLYLECSIHDSSRIGTFFDPTHHPRLSLSEYDSQEVEILCQTPKLRHLWLTDFILNWNTHSHLLHSLTRLTLKNVNSPKCQLTWKRFADILKGMPDLEVLDLENSLPAATREPVSWASTHFASLQRMSIECCAAQAETLLSCITFPPNIPLQINCFEPSGDRMRTDFSGVLSQIAHLYSNRLDAYFQTLILLNPVESTQFGLNFRLFLDDLTDEEMLDHYNIRADLEVVLSWKPGFFIHLENVVEAINHTFSCGPPLQDINRIYLEERVRGLRYNTLANTIGKLNQVSFIKTSKETGRLLVDALQFGSHDEDATSGSPFDPPYFPCLSEIYFEGSRFRAPYKGQIRDDDPTYLPLEVLSNCLIQRSRSGMRLSKLTFKRCRRMLKGDIVVLGKSVDKIDWDGLRY